MKNLRRRGGTGWARPRAAVVWLVTLLVATPGLAAPFSFTTIDVPGAVQTDATGINNAGRIVGFYHLAAESGVDHGFVLSDGSFTTIDYPNAISSQALGINAPG